MQSKWMVQKPKMEEKEHKREDERREDELREYKRREGERREDKETWKSGPTGIYIHFHYLKDTL